MISIMFSWNVRDYALQCSLKFDLGPSPTPRRSPSRPRLAASNPAALKMSSSFREWFEHNLRLQSLAYSTVVLIDANNINPSLQYDADVCRRAVAYAAREFGPDGARQPLVIAFNRPPLPNVNLNAGSSSSFRPSCDVPEFVDPPHFLRVVACSSYIMQVRGSMARPRCSVFCDDVANLGYYHNVSTSPRERFDGSTVRLPPGIDQLDAITENTCQLDDYLMAIAAYILTKLGKRVITVSEDKRFTDPEIHVPELLYPFVCVLAPCTISKQLVCAHPIFQADLADMRDAIPSKYPHPQYDKSTTQRYKQTEISVEGAHNPQFSRWRDAPDWLLFQTGQRKLAETCAQALKGRKKQRAKGEVEQPRSAALRDRFDKLEKPDPRIPRSKFADPFGGPPGLEETHQGDRQRLAAVLQELRRSRGETTPLPFCSRMRSRYAELETSSLQPGEREHVAAG